MHKVVVPKFSGVHRFACLALYRSLLRQCAPSASNAPWLKETKSLVRQKFQKYKSLQSPSQTTHALKAGYEALDLLESASRGSEHDAGRIRTLLAQTKSLKDEHATRQREITAAIKSAKLKAAVHKPPMPRKAQKQESIRHQEETARPRPDTPSILARPRPVVSGKRRVPVLVNARGIPYLRIKKPQPRNLSGLLRNKLERRWNWIERRDRLQLELLFAQDEDSWDALTHFDELATWTADIKLSINQVNRNISQMDMKHKRMAESMWKIVLAERELAKTEEERLRQLKE
ncbi:hypothetical protein NUU61_007948 [Penicillium alfredii]|uniref:Complex 1 LYR protein domain-containing protein n=1 Tax=Penicillium alfredii TaxID=1506179 RepID=A0A9W9JZ17_9EURO|nr:uncharacterized protein NUU61_007948 [Penicillium alfredii]KAJ5086641.1 hypothetical protein NUU61_007948 [Penicillium alfredii]